jgi:hypothetical protein
LKDEMLRVCTRPCLSASGEGYAAQMYKMRTGIQGWLYGDP